MHREAFDGVDLYNAVEAAYWSAVGVAVCFAMRDAERRPTAGMRYGLAAWLVAFGLSDVVEIFTGAWWRPWPLGLFKFVAGAAISLLALAWWRQVRRS